ncbi:hypothetical protein D3C78_1146780 [compost metagenome]
MLQVSQQLILCASSSLFDELTFGSVRNGLLHEGVEAFLRIRRLDLLLDLARNVRGLAITHAVIGELALFDHYGASHIHNRFSKAVS